MNRRHFLQVITAGGAVVSGGGLLLPTSARAQAEKNAAQQGKSELAADVIIAGGGLGGCAAALGALRNGLKVVLTEETDWLGGQISQQGVPMDEHQWIETFGGTRTYRQFRSSIRDYYRRNYPLTTAARDKWNVNPGNGGVSKLCHEPRVTVAVLQEMFARYLGSRQLIILLEHKVIGAEVIGDTVKALKAVSTFTGAEIVLTAPHFVDATELGDLLPLTKTEFVMGAESKKDTGELHAAEKADPLNQQSVTWCFAMDYVPDTNNVIARPANYEFWRDYVPAIQPPWSGKLLSWDTCHPIDLHKRTHPFDPATEGRGGPAGLWLYRRIADKDSFTPGAYPGDITIVNWPQNDYIPGPLIGGTDEENAKHRAGSKECSLAFFYWMQTEAPRNGDKQGFPELRLRGDVLGTEDGCAKYPYIREARRIKALFTVLEQHVGTEARAAATGLPEADLKAEKFPDSVGTGYYRIDLHPSTGGDNYIDVASLPFQIPLGALLPQRVKNLLPACKNIGTTHLTNGCYRLHPVEWNIGESVGCLVAFAQQKKVEAHAVREKKNLLNEFQNFIAQQGIERDWPKGPF